MRVQQRQCLFSILSREVFLPILQISVGEIGVRVSGIGIGEEVELEDLDGGLGFALAQIAAANDVSADFRP